MGFPSVWLTSIFDNTASFYRVYQAGSVRLAILVLLNKEITPIYQYRFDH